MKFPVRPLENEPAPGKMEKFFAAGIEMSADGNFRHRCFANVSHRSA